MIGRGTNSPTAIRTLHSPSSICTTKVSFTDPGAVTMVILNHVATGRSERCCISAADVAAG
jgi:hypothetical protein